MYGIRLVERTNELLALALQLQAGLLQDFIGYADAVVDGALASQILLVELDASHPDGLPEAADDDVAVVVADRFGHGVLANDGASHLVGSGTPFQPGQHLRVGGDEGLLHTACPLLREPEFLKFLAATLGRLALLDLVLAQSFDEGATGLLLVSGGLAGVGLLLALLGPTPFVVLDGGDELGGTLRALGLGRARVVLVSHGRPILSK